MPTSALQNIAISHQISVKTGIFRGRTESSAPTVQKGKSTRIRRKSTIKRVLSAGRCGHRPLRRETGNAAIFRPTHDFPIPVVGADASVRPRNSLNFSWPFVGADAHIGPSKYCDFASDLRKNGHFPRADRVARPYDAKSKPNAITSDRPRAGAFPFGRWDGSMRRPQASFEAQPRSARLLAPR